MNIFGFGSRKKNIASDPEASAAYQSLVRAGTALSESEFRAIRSENLKEREQFGDGRNAPYWPSRKLNGHYTLHRGVWIEDLTPVPSNRELDRIREEYQATHSVIKFTLVEGEQMAPMGENGAMIRVRASTVDVRECSWPTVSIDRLDDPNSWGESFAPASLPCEMSVTVKIR